MALLICVTPALSYMGWIALGRWRVEARARDAVSALTFCMMGPAPDAAASPVSAEATPAQRQLRAIAIGGDTANDATWPGRCEPYLRSATKALTRLRRHAENRCDGACCAGDPRCDGIDAINAELRRLRTYFVVGDRSGFDPQVLVDVSRSLGLLTGASEGAPLPPRAARLLDPRDMVPLYEGDYLRLLTDPAGGDGLSMLFYEEDQRYGSCRVTLGPPSEARCGALPASIPVGQAGELLAAEAGAPQRMYAQGKQGDDWVQALYDVQSGAEILRVSDRPSGGMVWSDGTVAHLEAGPVVNLHRFRDGRAEPPVPLAMAADVSAGPRLIHDEIVWAERTEEGRHRVLARRVSSGEEAVGPLAYLAVTPPLTRDPALEVCKTDALLALLIGANDGKGGVDATLLFRDATGWRAPIDVHIDTPQFGFTCRGDTATLSWIVGVEELPDLTFIGEVETEASLPVGGRYSVHRLRCGDGDCKHDRADVPLRRFSRSSRYVAGDAGDAMVVLWRSVKGDVRMKIGPLATLADAPERAVFDDPEHDGFGWDLERDPIIGRDGTVVVLLSRQIGTSLDSATYALVVREDGEVESLSVSRPSM